MERLSDYMLIKDHEQALAEKDREIEQIRNLLGCHRGYILESIRDLQSKTDDIPNIDRVRQAEYAYQQLMEQAIRFAKVATGDSALMDDYLEAQAFLKERT